MGGGGPPPGTAGHTKGTLFRRGLCISTFKGEVFILAKRDDGIIPELCKDVCDVRGGFFLPFSSVRDGYLTKSFFFS